MSPTIYPDGNSHDWSLEYDPTAADGKGRVVLTLDDQSVSLDLPEGANSGCIIATSRRDSMSCYVTVID
jgi:hypothetical protein